MDRTVRAMLLAFFVTFAAIAGGGLFLGFDMVGSLVTGLVLGLFAGALIWGAARRSSSFHEDEDATPIKPSFPGPPDRPDGTTPDEPDGPAGSEETERTDDT